MLKSSTTDLQKRGFASDEDLASLKDIIPSKLLNLLHSDQAVTRTAAAYHLSSALTIATQDLLQQLSVEKCLYTKITICETLKKGDAETAKQMIHYLGQIGKNQHCYLPDAVSVKKPYPLPRDIIARSLGKMDTYIFSILLEVLPSDDLTKISEVLDAIGFMAFYNQQLATTEHGDIICKTLHRFQDNELIVWNTLTCLSSFQSPQVINLLQQFSKDPTLLGDEAKRSLKLISTRQS